MGPKFLDIANLSTTGLLGQIDVVCTSEQIGIQTPDPRAFRILAERLDVSTSECLFVGDSPEQDIAGAYDAGMAALLVNRDVDHADGIAAAVFAELVVQR